MTGNRLTLDHVAVICRNLDQAARRYTDLGFVLTQRSSHQGPVPPTGLIQPWGTGNHCAMFRRGYLELLGITGPDRFKTHVDNRLRRYEGLHLIAFGCSDIAQETGGMRQRGAVVADPIVVTRDVPVEDGTRVGRFKIGYLDEFTYPEADFILISHETPETLWQPRLLTHPNGAVALEGVSVCVRDRNESCARLAKVLGPAFDNRFQLASGYLEVLEPKDLPGRFPGITTLPEPPKVVAVRIGVDHLAKPLALPALRNTIRTADEDRLVCIAGSADGGVIIEWVATNSEDSSNNESCSY